MRRTDHLRVFAHQGAEVFHLLATGGVSDQEDRSAAQPVKLGRSDRFALVPLVEEAQAGEEIRRLAFRVVGSPAILVWVRQVDLQRALGCIRMAWRRRHSGVEARDETGWLLHRFVSSKKDSDELLILVVPRSGGGTYAEGSAQIMTIVRHKDVTPSRRVARSDFAVTYAPPFGGVRHMSGAFSAKVVESSRGAGRFRSPMGFLIEASRSQAMRGGEGGRVTSPVRSS